VGGKNRGRIDKTDADLVYPTKLRKGVPSAAISGRVRFVKAIGFEPWEIRRVCLGLRLGRAETNISTRKHPTRRKKKGNCRRRAEARRDEGGHLQVVRRQPRNNTVFGHRKTK